MLSVAQWEMNKWQYTWLLYFFIHVHFVQYVFSNEIPENPCIKHIRSFQLVTGRPLTVGHQCPAIWIYSMYVWCCQKTPPLQLLCGIYIISNFIYKASQRYFIWPVYEIKINWNHTAGILKSFVLFIEPKKTIPLIWWDWPFKEIQQSFHTVNSLYKHYKQFSC